ncbi:MAG: hypothetical protein U1E38_01200 [Rhodospirillales bacterium]
MPSYLYDIGERSRVVVRFIAHVRSELRNAFVQEQTKRNLKQQAIAEKLGVNRSVISRQLTGRDNMTVRSVAELAWAMGWTPNFYLSKPREDGNYFITTDVIPSKPSTVRTVQPNTSNSKVLDRVV